MQYFKPLTHGGKSTHGNSLKAAQFRGEKNNNNPASNQE